MGRGGATSSRGRGKFKGFSRGGGRHFSRDLDPRKALKGEAGGLEDSEEDSEEEEEDSEDESSDDEGGEDPYGRGGATGQEEKLAPEMAAMNLKLGNTESVKGPEEQEMSRAERKALKKNQAAKKSVTIKEPGSDDDDEEEDDQPVKKAGGAGGAGKGKAAAPPPELSRREREAAEKKAAQERYQKLHAQGKTQEAKSDLARLQEVRRRREQAAAQREAEAQEAARLAAEKKEKTAARKI